LIEQLDMLIKLLDECNKNNANIMYEKCAEIYNIMKTRLQKFIPTLTSTNNLESLINF
jgi:hypothetical protein